MTCAAAADAAAECAAVRRRQRRAVTTRRCDVAPSVVDVCLPGCNNNTHNSQRRLFLNSSFCGRF